MRLIFDIETNGLLPELDTIHSLVIKDADTSKGWSCHDQLESEYSIQYGLGLLAEADELIGHNILKFDIPAIQKVYPWFEPKGKIFDTLICSRLIWSDLKERDFQNRARLIKKHGKERADALFPTKLIGSHGLEAWGRRLGEWKGDYAQEREKELRERCKEAHELAVASAHSAYEQGCLDAGKKPTKTGFQKYLKEVDLPSSAPTKEEIAEHVWGSWNQSMQDYCEQDVEVTHRFYERILSKNYSQRAIDLEHDFAFVIHLMENEGVPFDDESADNLERQLMVRKAEIEQELQEYFPPWEVRYPFTPKRDNKKLGYVAGKLTHKVKTVYFNPGSRDHIADRLIAQRGWEPTEFTDTGKPKVDEAVLKKLPWPEAKLLEEYFLIAKRLGQLSDGPEAWRNNVQPDGRIYHSVVTGGAVTGRCSHKKPNLAQVPKVKTDKEGNIKWGREGAWGAECRGLFHAPKGMVMVGADLSGLELRCLAHYMARYDEGAYVKELLEGDVHTVNQKAAGLPSRDNAKTFIYGFLYGAGDEKIGSIVGKGKKEGARLKKAFLDRTPALKELRNAVRNKTARKLWINGKKRDNPKYKGYLVGLDGRHLPIRYEHAALNTLLQSAGALISKEATVLLYRDLSTRGYVFGKDWALMLHVHDEVQLWARPEIADEIGEAAVAAFEQAGRNFEFRCPITGEYKKGETWRDTH